MARFTPAAGLEAAVARMVAPEVHRIARRVEVKARSFAPPLKTWVAVPDEQMRSEHVAAHGQTVPSNLKFALNSMDWDMKHRGVGPQTYLNAPRDPASPAVATIRHCKCRVDEDPDGIARQINAGPPVIAGNRVTVTVAAEGEWITEAEFGTVYPGNVVAAGTHFMRRAVAAVAAGG